MGEMLTLMGAADICFMGGSLIGDKVGGHNVLEPIALSKPTINGPSYFNFIEIINSLRECKAIYLIDDFTSLAETILIIISCNTASKSVHRANLWLKENKGALNRTLNKI